MSLQKTHDWLPDWARDSHPVYELETRRRVSNRALLAMRWGCTPTLLAITTLVLTAVLVLGTTGGAFWSVDTGFQTLLGFSFGLMVLIQVIGGAMANMLTIAQAAPSISEEVELQSWRLLRTTTLPLREIIMAKLAAVLTHLRAPFTGLVIIRFASTITGLLFYLFTLEVSVFSYWDRKDWIEAVTEMRWLPILVVTVVGLIYYVSQPFIQFVMNGVIGMLASSLTRSRSQSLAGAYIGRLAMWIGSILFHVATIYGLGFIVLGNWASPRYAPLEFFQTWPTPSEDLVLWVSCLIATVYVVTVLAAQIAFILGGLSIIERRARQSGV